MASETFRLVIAASILNEVYLRSVRVVSLPRLCPLLEVVAGQVAELLGLPAGLLDTFSSKYSTRSAFGLTLLTNRALSARVGMV